MCGLALSILQILRNDNAERSKLSWFTMAFVRSVSANLPQAAKTDRSIDCASNFNSLGDHGETAQALKDPVILPKIRRQGSPVAPF